MKLSIYLLPVIALLAGFSLSAAAQNVKNTSYQTVAHIKSDGTIQNSSYRTIGHSDGIPLKWATFYFFFSR